MRVTARWQHVTSIARLREAYDSLNHHAAPGVDGQTWAADGEPLEANLRDLSARRKRGAYHAPPGERVSIPKADGRQRPSGTPTLADKIVQRATVEGLNAVDAEDFVGFSYGTRPGRHAHHALDAVTGGIEKRHLNWGREADIRGWSDAIDHAWLGKCVEHRSGDQRVLRHIHKWLKAGVLEAGQWREQEEGTPQGGSASPVLANLYLHYVVDLGAAQWRRRQARGEVIIVRYCEDCMVGCQHKDEAEQVLRDLRERCRTCNLELPPDKTRLIEFGRVAAERRPRRGQGKPEPFDFLGLTHRCGQTQRGVFTGRRKTIATRLRRKLREMKLPRRRRRHWPVQALGAWLRSVVTGHYQDYGVPRHLGMRRVCRDRLIHSWCHTLRRRRQRQRVTWQRMYHCAQQWLPEPPILQPYPAQRLRVMTQGKSPVRSCRTPGSVRGVPGHQHPYRDRICHK